MQTNIAHSHARKKRYESINIDKVIFFAAIIAPLTNIPQLIKVWTAPSTTGVSAVSWMSFAFISLLWLYYGKVHREAPIILMNGSLFCVQSAIAIAVVVR